jgi:hypothetical protein
LLKRTSFEHYHDAVVIVSTSTDRFACLNDISPKYARLPRADKTPFNRGPDLLSLTILIC